MDWDYWRQVNPNVVGWVTVPGTNVNGPIVLAPANDPDYYLKHDVYGEPNLYGCLYLDASCAAAGLLGSRNAVVYGHNMSLMDGSMFTALARYVDAAYAADHAEMLVQTPDEKKAVSYTHLDVYKRQEPPVRRKTSRTTCPSRAITSSILRSCCATRA